MRKCNQSRPGFELMSPCPFHYDDNHYTTGTLKVTFIISSPSNLIFSLVMDPAILFDLSKVGFPNLFQVCRSMIAKSDLEFNCNYISLFRICTCPYFLMFNSSCSSDFTFFTQLLTFFYLARQCELLYPTRLQVRHFLFQ